uniref:Uncharacterized protein n=1 Tax=Pipistrellus kuhlii TaxID=59472 RepID=A0A7J7S3X2_PIPKU|nr:hypothetical protein mPipKuh1_010191 [Pipistrellus kuhlii]
MSFWLSAFPQKSSHCVPLLKYTTAPHCNTQTENLGHCSAPSPTSSHQIWTNETQPWFSNCKGIPCKRRGPQSPCWIGHTSSLELSFPNLEKRFSTKGSPPPPPPPPPQNQRILKSFQQKYSS